MVAKQSAGAGQIPITNRTDLDLDDVDYAVHLVHQVCCFAGAFDLLEEFRDPALSAAVERHDSGVLFDRLIYDFSFQGISDEIAANYMAKHGQATWGSVHKNLDRRQTCPKLKSYWDFHDCRYEKTTGTCGEPNHIGTCPVPTHQLRNGHLNQMAYSLYLFIRDVADGDLVGWIDDRLEEAHCKTDTNRATRGREGLIEPLRNVDGISDKVLAMALSAILIGAADVRPAWLDIGVQLIAVDSLVHNFLVRSGILSRFNAAHPYGPGCYRPNGCAELIRLIASRIDARQFNRTFPQVFPRFVQLAIWRYCSQTGLDICNGNRLDDRQSCQNRHCRLYQICDRICLK
jgi:hypothetical protein